MKILEDQLNLIKLAIQHINKLNKFGVNVAKSSFCYMNAQEITPGYSILKNFQNRRKFKRRRKKSYDNSFVGSKK